MNKVTEIEFFILDMDGTIYLGNKVIDGAIDFINNLNKSGKQYVFLTNNSSKSRSFYKAKLEKLGLEIDEDKIITSGEATIIYLQSIKPCSKIFLLGTPALEDEFITAGFKITNKYEEDIDFVVLGFDTTLTYEKVWVACDLIRDGVKYIATHPDKNCPLDGGKYMPDAGAIIELIYASTGKRPYIVGKPNPEVIECIIKKYKIHKDKIAMVGDRLYTDIQTGINAQITSILVLSGETTLNDYNKAVIKADFIYNSINDIYNELKGDEVK